MKSDDQIAQEIKDYCKMYNISLDHFIDVISNAKVIPMIRGKSFEYSVSEILKILLPASDWDVTNPKINAQSEIHDVDVEVVRKSDNKKIDIECKLAANDSFRMTANMTTFKVKCMRSRTVGDNDMATRMATKYGVTRESVLNHADSYRQVDFDYVVTTLGNSMWSTDENGLYVFSGTQAAHNVLSSLFPSHFIDLENFKDEAFNFLLFAASSKIVVSEENAIRCNRRSCRSTGFSNNCGFISNYPIINLNDVRDGTSPWKIISLAATKFDAFLG